jgi:16S rRNA (guanine527-N7)-methyltransferase
MTDAADLTVGGATVSRETFAALQQLESLVQRWTKAVNLVSNASLRDLWQRHIEDSAQLLAFCPQNAQSWLDLGSGGGFPGLVVAILAREARPNLRVTLAESDQRKATFLRQAAQGIGLNVQVSNSRIESLEPANADVISARALAPLTHLLAFAERHVTLDGVAIFPKGARFEEEIAEARKSWDFDVDVHPSLSEPEAAILVIRKIHRATHD